MQENIFDAAQRNIELIVELMDIVGVHDCEELVEKVRELKESRPTPDAPDGAKAAATLSGLYNCQLCGLEKCSQPGFCDDCLADPTESEIKSWGGEDTAPLVI